MTIKIPPSVARFERILFSGLIEAGLNPKDYKPKLFLRDDVTKPMKESGLDQNLIENFHDEFTAPAMGISQVPNPDDGDEERRVRGILSTLMIFQQGAMWYADLKSMDDPLFGEARLFNNVHTPEVFAAHVLVHIVKGDPLYPKGKQPILTEDGHVKIMEQDQ